MKKYRLKKEAVPFFAEKHATSIYDYTVWKNLQVDEFALEEVEDAYISYGNKTKTGSSTLSGWSQEEGSYFNFTIHFPSVKFGEHDKFSNGKITRELMNRIQRQIDNFYSEFATNDLGILND